MNKKIINYALTAILVTAFLVYGISSVSAEPIAVDSCRVINQPGEYILTQDITNVQAGCFRITANNVIFDGNGHVISGNELREDSDYGIFVRNVSGFNLNNINIEEFNVGISLQYADDSVIGNSSFKNSGSDGLEIINTHGVFFANNVLSNNLIKGSVSVQLYLQESSFNNISNNVISGSDQNGIYIHGGESNIFENNVLSYNNYEQIHLEYSDRNIFKDNNFSVSRLSGIGMLDSHNNIILSNSFFSSERYSIYLSDSTNNLIKDNSLSNNGRYALYLEYGSNSNDFFNNLFSNNRLGNIYQDTSLDNSFTNNTKINTWQPFTPSNASERRIVINTSEGQVVPSGSQRVVSGSNGSAVGSSASVASVSFLSTASVPMTSKTITANKKPSNNTKKKTIAVSNSNNKPANKVVSTTVTTVSTASKASTKTKTATVSQAQGSSKVIKLVERKKKGSVRNK